jgi:hypothetical protein
MKFFKERDALRHVPRVWRNTKVVFIPKPGKNDHIYAKDLHFFSIKSFGQTV